MFVLIYMYIALYPGYCVGKKTSVDCLYVCRLYQIIWITICNYMYIYTPILFVYTLYATIRNSWSWKSMKTKHHVIQPKLSQLLFCVILVAKLFWVRKSRLSTTVATYSP